MSGMVEYGVSNEHIYRYGIDGVARLEFIIHHGPLDTPGKYRHPSHGCIDSRHCQCANSTSSKLEAQGTYCHETLFEAENTQVQTGTNLVQI